MRLRLAVLAVLILTFPALAQVSVTTSATTQNFDSLGTTAAATLPSSWKVDKPGTVRTVGTFAAAVTQTSLLGGANLSGTASNGIYNFGSGTTTTGSDRAVCFLSSGTATQSGNLYVQLQNGSGTTLTGLTISYDVEKYRGGTNAAGFRMQMFYSTDGSTWTSAGGSFLTSFSADAGNTGFSPAPGATVSVSNQTLSVSIANGGPLYLAWNYSVSSGTTTTNAQALAIDNVSITGIPAAPSVSSINRASATPTNAGSVDYTVTFDQSVTGVDTSDFSLTTSGVTGASVSNVTGSGTTYTVTVNTGSGDGTIRLDLVDDDSIANGSGTKLGGTGAGNGNFTGQTYTIDKTAPTVQSAARADANPTIATTLHWNVTFSESVSGFDNTDLSFATTGGVVAGTPSISGSGSSYSVTLPISGSDGTIGLDVLNNGSIADTAGNALSGGTFLGQAYAIDHPPTVVSINRSSGSLTNAQSLNFDVTFSEAVTGVDTSDFTLTTTGITGASVTNVSGSGTTYTVTVDSGSGDGTLRLDLVDDDSIVDSIAQPLGGSGAGNGNFTGQSYTIDKTAPSVSSIVRANVSPTNAASVNFTVTFSEAVAGVDAGDFALTTSGVTGASITGVSGSVGSYTVTVNTGSGDGSIGLDLVDDDSITDAAANPLGGGGAGNGNFTGEVYTIQKSAPTVQSVTRIGNAATHAASVDYAVTFSMNVTGVDTTDFALTTTGVSGASVTNVSGSGTSYTVTVNTGSGDGTIRLDVLNDGSIVNDTNVPLASGFTSGEVFTIDKTPPQVVSITRAGGSPTNASSVSFTVTYSETVTGVSAQDWALTTSGVSGASVSGFSGSGTTYTVNVNTGSGDGTIRLDVVTGGTVIDLAGNLLQSGFTSGESYTIDRTSPTVQSIARANANPTSAASIDFTVTFSESVSGVDSGDFALATTGVTGASITGVSGSGASYTVSINTGSGSGTLGLNLVDNDSIADAANNLLGGSGAGNGNFTGEVYTVQKAPLAPTSLNAGGGNNTVHLTWTAPNGASTYNVKRATSSGAESAIATGIGTTSYDDNTAVNGTTYFYTVSASNAQGEGPDSNEATATPTAPPAPPSPVTAKVGDTRVVLSWGTVSGATSYNVKRSTTSGGESTIASAIPIPTYTDTAVTDGTTYYYVVSATSGSGEGANSSEVSATPNTPNNLGIVFSQVYGGGGNSGATYKNDFMELFNRGTQTVDLTGWSVQYSSATTTFTNVTNLSGSIAPGHYYLVQESAGAGGTVNLPTPDVTGTIAMGATAGKVAVAGQTTQLGSTCTGSVIADLVGYGATANCSETSPTAAPSNTTSVLRGNGGCTDTNNNSADLATGAVNPRNSATAANNCAAINNPPAITPPANPIATVNQDAAPFTVNLAGTDDQNVFNWSATPGTGISSVIVSAGQGTGNVTYTVSLQAAFSGTASFTASLSDNVNPPVTQQVFITVTPTGGGNASPFINPPSNPAAAVNQDAPPFPIGLTGTDDGNVFNWSATPGTGVSSVVVSAGQGTGSVTYTVSLNAGFSGTATFTASLSDNVNPPVTQLVNIAVTPAGGAPNHLVISQFYGGGGNSGATFTNDYVEIYNPTNAPVSTTGWTLQYASATSTSPPANIAPLGGIIGPGEYYLVQLASNNGGGAPLPVTPNITGSINMSATSGKIALVSNGDPLPGACGSALADPDLVDYVGYGSANCAEGNQTAPAGSNTTALFRKNGGATDTNNNLNDFITGAPSPRRTTPIQEVGPAIVNTDPTTNATTAPRDASITINFTEPVDVVDPWYNINCASTGSHNSATVANKSTSYEITPNVNFLAGEQCTVTIFASQVHDSDPDDSAPGTDTLPADYTWSFTIATGAAPPYPASVHLTMGNPSNAVADTNVPNNYLMSKAEYAESYNRDKGTPNWVSWHLSDEWIGSLPRNDTFRPDPSVLPTWYRVLDTDYQFSGFDRGHMCPNADRDNQNSIPINQATFLMSNMVPQAPDNNQGPWANLENYLRSLLPADELYIVSGPYGVGGTGSNGFATTVANGHVTVPEKTWKVVLVLPKASGDDVARVTATTRTIAVLMPNTQGIRTNDPNDWQNYLTTVDAVEALTGYDFFSNVPPAIQASIEAGTNGANPPGAANESVSTNEDTSKSITLDAVAPSGNPLTYTIVTPPSHGQLTGSGANQTYTPAPDFNGTDTFTYRANDGATNSNTATVTITVLEVNDPPSAADDSKTADANMTLVFSASDLTLNDVAGPPNEASQTLTVTALTPGTSTHGVLSLSAGQVSYTPDLNYSGPASFGYTVCDNGTTAGLSASLCATATVNLTVRPVATTHLGVVAAGSPLVVGIPFGVTVTALDAGNLTVTNYRGTVHFSSPSGSIALPPDYTFTAGDAGAHTFMLTAAAPGTITINVTDNGGFSGSTAVTITCPAPSAQGSVTEPAGVCANSTGNQASVANLIGATTYTWTANGATITSGQGTPNITFTAGAAGIASFQVVATNGIGCIVGGDAGQSTIFVSPTAHIDAPAQMTVCANDPVAVNVTLTGAAPFTIHWSDGFTQSNVNTTTTFRTMSFTATTNLSVATISDANCTSGGASNNVHVDVNGPPAITQQPQSLSIQIGNDTTLTVAATGMGVGYYWYEGNVGDTSHLVASGTPSYTTPHLHDPAKYWARVFTSCGYVDSDQATVTVFIPGRRRGANH